MDNIKFPKMEDRHEKREHGKRDICAYTLNNPATFNQIMEATGLSESFARFLIFQLKFDKELKVSSVFDSKLSRNIVTYEAIAEHKPIKYVRKSFFTQYKGLRKLSDDIILTVLKKLVSEPAKAVAIDLDMKVGTVYYIRKKYGVNNVI